MIWVNEDSLQNQIFFANGESSSNFYDTRLLLKHVELNSYIVFFSFSLLNFFCFEIIYTNIYVMSIHVELVKLSNYSIVWFYCIVSLYQPRLSLVNLSHRLCVCVWLYIIYILTASFDEQDETQCQFLSSVW